MNHAMTFRHPEPLRIALVLSLSIAFWLASAFSLAPTLARTVSAAAEHSAVCKCAHCPGGRFCCCRLMGKCLMR